MARWEDNIYGFVTKKDWLDIGAEVPTRPNDPVDQLFGDEQTDNLVAYWETIAAEYQLPMMAQFHGFDTESRTTFRTPIDSHNIEKGLIKVKINQSERLRAMTRNGVQDEGALYEYVMDDGIRLADQVITRTKVAKNELLATGSVTIKENDLDLTVDYGVKDEQKNITIDLTGDVPAQLDAIAEMANGYGTILNGMYLGTKALSALRRNESLSLAIYGVVGQGQLVKKADLLDYLAGEYGLNTVLLNDLLYGADAKMGADGRPVITKKRYYPEDKITFFGSNSAGKLGTGIWGVSPEADVAELMKVNPSGELPYVYISQWTEKDPAVLWTKASGLFMPALFDPSTLFISTLDDGE